MAKSISSILFLLIAISFESHAQSTFESFNTKTTSITRAMTLPQNFYNQHLGFFCKKESQLQKSTSLNLFVRLGSKNYVDYLERKPNARAGY